MYRDRGVYIFSDKDKMRIFAYDSENAVEYPPLTYAEQLVDFLEIDMTPFRKAVNRNFKRVERYENSSWDSSVMELTFDEYSAWLDKASKVRRLYLQGKATAEVLRGAINDFDV